ncbi:hypothetical protein [Chromobacterium vaccinii]|uniref:hypothetical protein n=1 Tax=Chromobacterium vaccinii TaxID=1108595 RepID=UPI00345982D1
MSLDGEITIVGHAYFSRVQISSRGKHYIHIDVVYEGMGKDGGDHGIGLIVCGEEAKKIETFLGFASSGHVLLCGKVGTKTWEVGKRVKARSGINVTTMGVTRESGGQTLQISTDFVMFR